MHLTKNPRGFRGKTNTVFMVPLTKIQLGFWQVITTLESLRKIEMKLTIVGIIGVLTIAIIYYFTLPLGSSSTIPKITKTNPNIEWTRYPKTSTKVNFASLISEVTKGNVYAVTLLHGGKAQVYTKDYRFIESQTNDPKLAEELSNEVHKADYEIQIEQE